jgi:hypothetical protein
LRVKPSSLICAPASSSDIIAPLIAREHGLCESRLHKYSSESVHCKEAKLNAAVNH